jgi:glycosyltransferase involved in cell wall biosynthesis
MKTRICYIISDIDKALAFEWVAERLDKTQVELYFILLNAGNSALEVFLNEKNIPVFRIPFFDKKNIPGAIVSIHKILKKHKIQVVHCHLFAANLTGLVAAQLAGIKKRIYTRHHSTLHHDYFPRAVWYDKFLNFMATDIVAISEVVRNVLIDRENVSSSKVHLIHHGFDLAKFAETDTEKSKKLGEKYQTQGKFPVIGVIARYTNWKGIQFVIPAFEQILKKYPQAHLILANARGDYASHIKTLLSNLSTNSYTEIAFEEDLYTLYTLFDVFVHVPVNDEAEAFGQTYVESLAAGIPAVFTLSGVANEFIENDKNGLVVDFKNSEEITTAIVRILNDTDLQKRLTEQGKKDVEKRFSLEEFINRLEQLYQF